jgi:hypothetical protein
MNRNKYDRHTLLRRNDEWFNTPQSLLLHKHISIKTFSKQQGKQWPRNLSSWKTWLIFPRCITISFHGTESFLTTGAQSLKKFPEFYESTEYAHESATGSYPEPDKSSPYRSILLLYQIPPPFSLKYIVPKNPSPRASATFRKKTFFYGDDISVSWRTPKLEDHCLLVVRDCLFIHGEHFLHPQPEDAPMHANIKVLT